MASDAPFQPRPEEPCRRPGDAASPPPRLAAPVGGSAGAAPPDPAGGDLDGALTDPFGRRITYLRLSITESCNFRCSYCRPVEEAGAAALPPVMSRAEVVRLARLFVSRGVTKVRLTGGEPTLHPELAGIVEDVAALDPAPIVALTTNGVLLPRLAARLRAAGLSRVNVSLDTLDRDAFRRITGRDRFGSVRQGLDAALAAGFTRVKVNVVVIAGVNEDQLVPLALMARDLPVDVRFIDYMPMPGNAWEAGVPLSGEEVERRLRQALPRLEPLEKEPEAGPARLLRAPGFLGRIGLISPFSVRFCSDCNRVRVTARGTLRLCLLGGGEADLLGPLRAGASDSRLGGIVRDALAGKAERHPLTSIAEARPPCGTPMWAVGG